MQGASNLENGTEILKRFNIRIELQPLELPASTEMCKVANGNYETLQVGCSTEAAEKQSAEYTVLKSAENISAKPGESLNVDSGPKRVNVYTSASSNSLIAIPADGARVSALTDYEVAQSRQDTPENIYDTLTQVIPESNPISLGEDSFQTARASLYQTPTNEFKG